MKRRTKRQLVLFVASTVIGALLLVMIAFNVLMSNYIDSEAHAALEEELLFLESDALPLDDDITIEWAPANDYTKTMQVNFLFLDEGRDALHPFLTEREKKLARLLDARAYPQGAIHRTTIDDERFYLSFVETPSLLSGDEEFGEYVLLYVNASPLVLLSRTMNGIFTIVLVLFTLVAGLWGIRLGQRIENAEEKMQHFFQNASHELKTPIMSIQGYAEGWQTGVIPAERATSVILSESEKMSDLVEELLFLSKLESGQLHETYEPLDWNELVFDSLRTVEPIAAKRHVTLVVDPARSAPLVRGDERQLMKAVTNVLTNAVAYARSTVTVRMEARGESVTLAVIDDGDGIAPDDLPHIFERFYTGASGNTGIELALTKEIVTRHNGTIDVASDRSGTTFTFTFLRNAR